MTEGPLDRVSKDDVSLRMALIRDFWLNEQTPGDPGDGPEARDARLVMERLLNVRAAAYPCYLLPGRSYSGPCPVVVSLVTGLVDMEGTPRPASVSQKRWGAGLRAAARAAWLEPAVIGFRDTWLWVVSERGLGEMGIEDPFYRSLVERVQERHHAWTQVTHATNRWWVSQGQGPSARRLEFACAPGVEDPQVVRDAMSAAVAWAEADATRVAEGVEALRAGVRLGREMLEASLPPASAKVTL